MKKLLFLITFVTLFSCSEDEVNGEFHEATLGNIKVENYKETDKLLSRIKKISPTSIIIVDEYDPIGGFLFDSENLDFNMIVHEIESNINNVKRYLIIYEDKLTLEVTFASTLTVSYSTTGNILSYQLENINNGEVLVDQNIDQYELNKTDGSNNGSGNLICFKTFDSCYNHLTTSNTPLDDVLMNTIPFYNAGVWVLCQINGEIIQESHRFKGASRCKTII